MFIQVMIIYLSLVIKAEYIYSELIQENLEAQLESHYMQKNA